MSEERRRKRRKDRAIAGNWRWSVMMKCAEITAWTGDLSYFWLDGMEVVSDKKEPIQTVWSRRLGAISCRACVLMSHALSYRLRGLHLPCCSPFEMWWCVKCSYLSVTWEMFVPYFFLARFNLNQSSSTPHHLVVYGWQEAHCQCSPGALGRRDGIYSHIASNQEIDYNRVQQWKRFCGRQNCLRCFF